MSCPISAVLALLAWTKPPLHGCLFESTQPPTTIYPRTSTCWQTSSDLYATPHLHLQLNPIQIRWGLPLAKISWLPLTNANRKMHISSMLATVSPYLKTPPTDPLDNTLGTPWDRHPFPHLKPNIISQCFFTFLHLVCKRLIRWNP